MVYVEGRLQTREYTDRDGNTRSSTEILAGNMTLMGGRGPGDGGGQAARSGESAQAGTANKGAPAEPTQQGQTPSASEPDDDLPF